MLKNQMIKLKSKSMNLGLLMIFACLLNTILSCASVPDVPVCKELELTRAYCIHTISNREYYVDDAHPFVNDNGDRLTWWDMRATTIQVPAQSWAKIKAFIITQCKRNNKCAEITSWDRTVDAIDNRIYNNQN